MFRKEEDLIKNQTQERKALPKRIRQEMKAREMMFRESMRISVTNLNEILKPTEEKERIKKVINSRKFWLPTNALLIMCKILITLMFMYPSLKRRKLKDIERSSNDSK